MYVNNKKNQYMMYQSVSKAIKDSIWYRIRTLSTGQLIDTPQYLIMDKLNEN
jgi:hypothetical protein